MHLELPEDIAAEEANVPLIAPHPIDLPVAPSSALERAAAMIIAAERPLIMLGAAASRPHLAEPLSAFVRRLGIPFFNTQMGKGAVSGGSNLYLGTAALSERDYVHQAIDRADLILAIGHDTVEKPPFIMGPAGARVIHVGHTSATVEQVFFPHAEVVGDMGASLSMLAERLEGKLTRASALIGLRQEILQRIGDRAIDDGYPLTPQRIVHDVRAVMPEDGIVTLDNGMYKIWFARNYRTRVANTLLLDNALAAMGAGLPSAIMAALLRPERRVLAVCGDGGFMMNSQEMETAVRLGVHLVVLILEDHAYGMIRWKQAVEGFADWGMTFGNPDFIEYAKAYGATGHRVEAADELIPTLEAAFQAGGVHLVAVPIDYSENMRVLVDELKACAAGRRAGLTRLFPVLAQPSDHAIEVDRGANLSRKSVRAALAGVAARLEGRIEDRSCPPGSLLPCGTWANQVFSVIRMTMCYSKLLKYKKRGLDGSPSPSASLAGRDILYLT